SRKDYGNYSLFMQTLAGTELDDVKKLLKGRSNSVSPTRSSCASITLPVPKKASVETKTVSVASQSGQYDTLDAILPTFSWSTSTLPSTSTTVVAGNTSSYSYQVGTNNMAGGTLPLSATSPSGLHQISASLLTVYGFQNNLAPTSASVLTTNGTNINANLGGYGVQKNVSNGGTIISTGVSTSESQTDDSYKQGYKFILSEKENVPAKRDTELLILAKDSGKQFTSSSSSLSGDSIKKEKLISSYTETMPLKSETGNSYCEQTLKTQHRMSPIIEINE
uniref:Uncharacterized protein n=1 Tax=Stegastes partitus TaxID=144197 RepID=A0A3B5AI11_9TELE